MVRALSLAILSAMQAVVVPSIAKAGVYSSAPSPPGNLRTVSQTATIASRKGIYGVFCGSHPTGPSSANIHGAWIGRTVQYGIAYSSATWDDIAGNTSNTRGWQAWKAAVPGRKMVFGIGLLPKTISTESLATAATGAYDEYFTSLAKNLISLGMGDSVIRLGWEFNGKWFSWSAIGKAADFKAAWIHYVKAMRAVPGANFKFCWNPANNATSMTASDAFPGDAYVDEIGIDFYDTAYNGSIYYPAGVATQTAQQNAWTRNVTRLNGYVSFAKAHGKPVSFPEWGVAHKVDLHGGDDDPYYIQHMYDYIADPTHNIAWYAYFDSDARDGAHKLSPPSQFPRSSALYRSLFGSGP